MTENDQRVLNNRYELHRQIARGGMAQVYLSRDRTLDRPVAVKELASEFAVDETFVERFRREAQAAAGLTHPNVVGVYDWGEEEGTYYIVMEYVDGPSLSKVLRSDGPLHPRRVAEIASEVAAGLGFAHAAGVVHRDVKPGNVLLTRSGIAKVTDFGIARAMTAVDEDLTQVGSVMGTATYFSPEQAQGKPVDPRSDLYSLGVMMYEMVTGRALFTGETPLAIAYKHVQDEPPRPTEVIPDIPYSLEAVIMKLLQKRPEDRYASAEDLRADLNRFLSDKPTLASQQGEVGEPTRVEAPTVAQPATVAAPVATMVDPLEEDEEEEASKSGVFIAVLAILILLLGGLIFWYLSSTGDEDLTTVPPLHGLTVEEAEELLIEAELTYRTEDQPSNTVPEGRIVSQDPARGTQVEKGTEVLLTVSTGVAEVEMIDLSGRTQGDAERWLTDNGLVPRVETEEVTEGDIGVVLRQSIAPGETARSGEEVILTVSKAPGEDVVPNVEGQPLAQAQANLEAQEFRIGRVDEEPHASIGEGRVIRTDPVGGTSQPRGTRINIVVSTGPEQAEVPNVVGNSEAQAGAELGRRGLEINVEYRDLPAGDSNDGRVMSQDPTAGTRVDPGTPVTVTVGRAAAATTTTTTADDSNPSDVEGNAE